MVHQCCCHCRAPNSYQLAVYYPYVIVINLDVWYYPPYHRGPEVCAVRYSGCFLQLAGGLFRQSLALHEARLLDFPAGFSASIVQGSAIGPVSYVVNALDLRAVTPGNELCKYADDT